MVPVAERDGSGEVVLRERGNKSERSLSLAPHPKPSLPGLRCLPSTSGPSAWPAIPQFWGDSINSAAIFRRWNHTSADFTLFFPCLLPHKCHEFSSILGSQLAAVVNFFGL